MIVWLPHLTHEPFPYNPKSYLVFDEYLVKNNVSILSSSFGKNDERVAYILSIMDNYSEVLPVIKTARLIQEQTVLSNLVELNCSGKIMDINNFKSLLLNIIDRQGSTILLSDTHASTALTIETCKNKAGTDVCLGVVCVDAHADFYNGLQTLWKGNTFLYLLANNFIEAMVIVGVPKFRQLSIRSKLPEDINRKIVMLDGVQDGNKIKEILGWLCNQNIDQVFYSIDIDGLLTKKLKITATEYCPFHVLLNIAKYDWATSNIEVIEQNLNDVIGPPSYQGGGRRNLLFAGDTGLNIQEVIGFLGLCFNFFDSKGVKNGIEINKSIIRGDIVELFGPDIGSNTAKAVSQIVKVLLD